VEGIEGDGGTKAGQEEKPFCFLEAPKGVGGGKLGAIEEGKAFF
jgi:hypothetical protein